MADFAASIQEWYRLNSRKLPWRENKNPYFIWLSEVMLQQTRVDQATNFFLKFKKEFPSICDLAKASEDKVLNLWQGLGYYSRARNLHFTSKVVCTEYKGVFPEDYKSIRSLKGIGDYTAAAIGSIAFNLPYAVVDGNVYRVLSRYYGIDLPIDSTDGKKYFAKLGQELLNLEDPGTYNQAIMEFGAVQCTPKNPDCDRCPLSQSCVAFEKQLVDRLPIKSKKTKIRERYLDYFIVTDKTNLYLKKRTEKDIWQGLYDFPLRDTFNLKDSPSKEIAQFEPLKHYLDAEHNHILSHQKLSAKFWIVEVDHLSNSDYVKVKLKDIQKYPLPQLLVKYLKSSSFFNEL